MVRFLYYDYFNVNSRAAAPPLGGSDAGRARPVGREPLRPAGARARGEPRRPPADARLADRRAARDAQSRLRPSAQTGVRAHEAWSEGGAALRAAGQRAATGRLGGRRAPEVVR